LKILALDLGTKTGWALSDNGVVTSGTWVLAKPEEIERMRAEGLDRCCDFRSQRLRQHIDNIDPHVVYFEDIQFAKTLLQVQLWASLRAMVWLRSSISQVVAVDVGTLKKFATGKGNADKEHMAAAAIKQGAFLLGRNRKGKPVTIKPEPGGESGPVADDNEIDAWWLLQYALKNGTTV